MDGMGRLNSPNAGLPRSGRQPFVARILLTHSAVGCAPARCLDECKVSLRLQRHDKDTKEGTDEGLTRQKHNDRVGINYSHGANSGGHPRHIWLSVIGKGLTLNPEQIH